MKNNNLKIKTLEKNDLVKLAAGGRNGGFALSFYLGLKNDVNFRSEANSVLSGEAEKIKNSMEYSKSDKRKILAMFGVLKKEIAFLRLPPNARTLVFFLKGRSKIVSYRIPVFIPSKMVIEADHYIYPLVRSVEQFSRYLAAVVERDKAEFISIFLGEIEKEPEVLMSDVPKKIKTSASDDWKGWREKKIERHIEDHLKKHFKAVAQKIREYFVKNGFNYLIIGGHKEIKAKFEEFLDKKTAEKLIGFFSFSQNERSLIKKRALLIINKYEKVEEEKIVNDILENAESKKWMAVLGIDSVLENFYLGKINMFVIGANYKKSGFICGVCHYISLLSSTCLSCGGRMERIDDITDEIIEEALKNKIKIKQLFNSHKNFDRFGIAAFLKGY